jgi:transcription initiation factor IIE alpha subunit
MAEKRKISPQIRKLFKDLHIKIGAAGLAILFGLAERSLKVMNDTFERKSLSRILREEEKLKDFYDYYDEFYKSLQGIKKSSYRSTLYRLEKRGLIARFGAKTYKLTNDGNLYYKGLIDKFSNRRSKWDGKYRIIFFDIKEMLKSERN